CPVCVAGVARPAKQIRKRKGNYTWKKFAEV
ncbi:MAG: hypothetical protein ACI9W2_000323, partial [Gammaproteobacteria bacterium]